VVLTEVNSYGTDNKMHTQLTVVSMMITNVKYWSTVAFFRIMYLGQ
jgi:hypothetical protein